MQAATTATVERQRCWGADWHAARECSRAGERFSVLRAGWCAVMRREGSREEHGYGGQVYAGTVKKKAYQFSALQNNNVSYVPDVPAVFVTLGPPVSLGWIGVGREFFW